MSNIPFIEFRSRPLGPAPLLACLLWISGCGQQPDVLDSATTSLQPVDGARIEAAAKEEWLSHGRTYSEQRFSPLDQINEINVGDLSLAWFADLPTSRGIEATPLVADGVLYTTGAWSIVYAYDAVNGRELWRYDPKVPRVIAAKACCDAVNRGPAIWSNYVYVGTLDGRLIAIDRHSGELAWETLTVDPNLNLTITGAPRVAEGNVLIGNGGADMGPVRGYVSAYDSQTGDLNWRFYTVPGDPRNGFEDPGMKMAAETWTGEWWKIGGGGTAWDAIVFDPELRLVYIGVGNGAPWNQRIRSPGGGDNLFLSSIVAVDIDSGEYVWHYQTTPGEVWDYTATQSIILADLEINNASRKVIMQAPKNGFFYVIDRETGELISAEPYSDVTWASRIDLATGRPVEHENARYPGDEVQLISPGPGGAHNWHPMAYSTLTKLAYIPVIPSAFPYQNAQPRNLRPGPVEMGVEYGGFSPPDNLADEDIAGFPAGYLSAWDPVTQQERWRAPRRTTWNGGVLATGGNLVFQGTANGFFQALRADNGELLWSRETYTGVMAGPISYSIDGDQFVAVMAGWGGVLATHAPAFLDGVATQNYSRVLVYKLGGDASLPAPTSKSTRAVPPAIETSQENAALGDGKLLFDRYCQFCHGAGAISGDQIPDLRYSGAAVHEIWHAIVVEGQLEAAGMPQFGDYLSESESESIQTYILDRAAQIRQHEESH